MFRLSASAYDLLRCYLSSAFGFSIHYTKSHYNGTWHCDTISAGYVSRLLTHLRVVPAFYAMFCLVFDLIYYEHVIRGSFLPDTYLSCSYHVNNYLKNLSYHSFPCHQSALLLVFTCPVGLPLSSTTDILQPCLPRSWQVRSGQRWTS